MTSEDEDGNQRLLEIQAESHEHMMELALAELDEGEYIAGYSQVQQP